ncbi:MAG TPA: ATP-binding protein, partial [Candidatus Eisenbacteria bacterium]|nr:ATP-binding protein [Candidatus Eisenbacteria bacterium]
ACAVLRADPESLNGRDLTEVVKAEDPNWLSTDPVDRLGTPRSGRKLKAKVAGARRVLRVGVWPLGQEGGDQGMLVSVRDGRGESDPEEVKDHLTSLGELSACVAHEIRNPLTGIRTTVQFVTSKLAPADPQREPLGEVIAEIDRIEQFIEDLLLFARPAEVTRAKGDLNALLGRVLDAMAPQFEEAKVEVRRAFSPEVPPLSLSPDAMQQVAQNLLRNAMEAMPEGGRIRITTTLRRFRSGRTVVELFVSDTGHGIPEDLHHQIFKPFFTTRPSGTGLGLPISASIIRAHGGRIAARNRAGGGTTFRVTLPVEDGRKDAA